MSDHEDDEAEELLRDPYVQETIEKALAPYAGVAPPDLLLAMRAMLEDAMTTHPYAVGIVKQLRARRPPVATEEGVRGGGGRAPDGKAGSGGGAA
jgi:hypothetical protein